MGVLEAVELKSSSCYNTDREVMKMAQSKAHIAATGRFTETIECDNTETTVDKEE